MAQTTEAFVENTGEEENMGTEPITGNDRETNFNNATWKSFLCICPNARIWWSQLREGGNICEHNGE